MEDYTANKIADTLELILKELKEMNSKLYDIESNTSSTSSYVSNLEDQLQRLEKTIKNS